MGLAVVAKTQLEAVGWRLGDRNVLTRPVGLLLNRPKVPRRQMRGMPMVKKTSEFHRPQADESNKFDQANGVLMIHEIPKSIKNFYTENRRLSKR